MYTPCFLKLNRGVPILKRSEIEQIAENFVRDFQPEVLEEPGPVNVDMFVEDYLNVMLDYDYLSNDHRYLGMTVFNDTDQLPIWLPERGEAEFRTVSAGTIIIDSYLEEYGNEGRRNYTLGHECWHWIAHKAYFSYNPSQMSLFEKDSEPFIQCRDVMNHRSVPSPTMKWDLKKWMEWQADVFSAALLMPKESVMRLVANNINVSDTDLVGLVSLCFKVSKTAAKYRLIDLGIIKNLAVHTKPLFSF